MTRFKPQAGRRAPSYSRHLKSAFLFLGTLVVMANLLSLFMLDRTVRREEQRVTDRVQGMIDEMRLRWLAAGAGSPSAANVTDIVRSGGISDLTIALRVADSESESWEWLVLHRAGLRYDTEVSVRSFPPTLQRGMELVDGVWFRSYTVATSWEDRPAVIVATVAAPTLGMLTAQLNTERWTRALVIVGFLAFMVLFYRAVLVPFQDMRRRAAALAETGILPTPEGGEENDPEYVMASFDRLLAHFSSEAIRQRAKAADSSRQARNLEKFNEYILSSLSTGVVILNREGRVLRFNRAAEEIFALPGATVIGKGYEDSGLPEELISVLREGVDDQQVHKRLELQVRRHDSGEVLALGINTSIIRNEDDQSVGLSLLLSDLTRIRQLERDIAENRRLADLGELSAGLAHQLRNAIAAIFGYGKMLRRIVAADDAQSRWVDDLVAATADANEMVSRFLDFARPLHAESEPVDLIALLRMAAETVAPTLKRTGCEFRIVPDAGDPEPTTDGDDVLLRQVFINLIQNAAEAGASVVEVRLGAESSEPVVIVEVSDNGPGISPDDQTRIFQPFFTTKNDGTGLGLAVARKIVAHHRGILTLAESSAAGSVFRVSLPASDPARAATRSAARAGQIS